MQERRFAGTGYTFNSEIGSGVIQEYCKMDAQKLLEKAYEKLALSARAYHKILRVSRTIADLEESEKICANHVAEAIGYRLTDK